MTKSLTIKCGNLTTPEGRVLAVEAMVQVTSALAGTDPSDGIMMCLTAAVHLAMKHSGKPASECLDKLAYSLGCATVAADEFFTPTKVH